ncbi:uncharacterized protein B0I36DRAFT_117849 [Microdochium trichocladiopsis]|uniref:Ferric reductase NAD binding domain-containing protein n=1 Tax=Microdochium trichocladiopsis TaxID=1682393 RepID=A0A9P9BN98_9PEZI|nr:uncharacterized protein B0I36DRAFT_117849 [Microdochium trichocladiopsis]KAH7031036.1 hypothetical protein B0I36DRAFT_117849 [Microdochium trichocladiopsis]
MLCRNLAPQSEHAKPLMSVEHSAFHGHAMNVAWWDISESSPASSVSLLLLMQARGQIASLLAQDVRQHSVMLEGPYRYDLRLQQYENVSLAAKGVGIAGILPNALDLVNRRRHDARVRSAEATRKVMFRDMTRRVDLFWVLDHNSQQKWLRQELKALQALDSGDEVSTSIAPSYVVCSLLINNRDYCRCGASTRPQRKDRRLFESIHSGVAFIPTMAADSPRVISPVR